MIFLIWKELRIRFCLVSFCDILVVIWFENFFCFCISLIMESVVMMLWSVFLSCLVVNCLIVLFCEVNCLVVWWMYSGLELIFMIVMLFMFSVMLLSDWVLVLREIWCECREMILCCCVIGLISDLLFMIIVMGDFVILELVVLLVVMIVCWIFCLWFEMMSVLFV